MIQQGTSRKILIISLALLLVALVAASIFIAVRLQQDQAPSDSFACSGRWWETSNCGSNCEEFFSIRPHCCTTDDWWHINMGVPKCASDPTPPGSEPVQCYIVYGGNAFTLRGDTCSSVKVYRSNEPYDGNTTRCPTDENRTFIGNGSNGASYSTNPAPGECVQIDADGENTDGGVCDCNPPVVTPVCDETCNTTDRLCSSGLSCTNVGGGDMRCRLPANPTSATCQPEIIAPQCTSVNLDVPPNAGRIVVPGEQVTITGWAQDEDGFSRIEILENGNIIGNATITQIDCNNPSDPRHDVCSAGFTTNVYRYNYTYTIPANAANASQIEIRARGYDGEGFTAASCEDIGTFTVNVVQMQCIDLDENGSDPIASGIGNLVEYTLTYQNASTTNPYPNIRLRVGPQASPVGRDALNTTSVLVAPSQTPTFDSVTQIWTYRFRWEAASTSGTGIAAGTYDVRALLDGSNNVVSTPAACTETITVSQTVQPEPLFNIVKSGAVVCEVDGDARIDYTITASNISAVSGTIDFVRDNYDANAVAIGLTPTNINPTYGTIASGQITWIGDLTARTYTAGQSKNFTYSLTIPAANLLTFAAQGVINQAQLQYDTSTTQDNSVTFDLRTMLSCASNVIPNTGIFDDARLLLIGMLFIGAGIIVYKSKWGYKLSEQFIGKVYESLEKQIDNAKESINIKPYEVTILDNLEKKASGIKKRSHKKKHSK